VFPEIITDGSDDLQQAFAARPNGGAK